MRDILNISFPKSMTEEVKKAVRSGHYSSTSEFIRAVVRDWMEGKLLVDLEKSKKEIKSGKGKVLRSLKDLR